MHALDLALFGGFIVLTVVVILFRRFHQFETLVKPDEIGPTAWGLYAPKDEDVVPVAVTRQAKPKA